MTKTVACFLVGLLAVLSGAVWPAAAFETEPWRKTDRAIVLDAYEMNIIDWEALAKAKRVAGFISKASDGLPEIFNCKGKHEADSERHCRTMWRKYAVTRELYQTRRLLAKSMGLLWGAYHLARPGNPVDQANHFLDFAKPAADEVMVLDLEGLDEKQYMSLADAELFARHIKARTGRYPVLYANHITARAIANQRDRYTLLSRLPLWYARYKPDIAGVFPMGNWDRYHLWQFSSGINCTKKSCPYRVAGTLPDIDVNVADMTKAELARAWPQGGLVPARPPALQLLVSATGALSNNIFAGLDMTVTGSIGHGLPDRSGIYQTVRANLAYEQDF